jgi:hypothetical protein
MFEVIISLVRTGRVQHRLFDTHAEAAQFADARRDAWLYPKPRGDRSSKPRSARDIRIEIVTHDLPAIRRLAPLTPVVAAVA